MPIPSERERSLRIIDRRFLKAQFQFEPRDLWIGLFWRQTEMSWHFYICIVPLLPLHITFMRKVNRDRVRRIQRG